MHPHPTHPPTLPGRPSPLPPETPIQGLDWIPKKSATSLIKLGLVTLGDLVTHYPSRHEDRRRFVPFPDGPTESPVLLSGILVQARYLPYGGWKKGYEAILEEPDGLNARVTLRWFNAPYIGKLLATGQTLVVYGKAKLRGKKVVIDFPEFEILEEDADPDFIHFDRIVPVHPAGEGLSPKKLRELIHTALDHADLASIPFLLSKSSPQVFRDIHFPGDDAALDRARHTIVGEEFFAIQALIAARRARVAQLPGSAKAPPGRLLTALLDALPFAPTRAQKTAIAEIKRDLARPTRMTRLLQGDVGSGKTLVALASALTVIESGHQAVLMAPTQILAEQHHLNLSRLLTPLGIEVHLRTGATPAKSGSGPQFLAPQFLIGTHALLHDPAELADPGLIIIDEQHKFGVLQRAKLIEGPGAPDVLVMTATPIPRTLAQTAYGDLDVTTLNELPPGRGKIITRIRPASKLPDATKFIRDQIEAGRQIYIVYPLIEESDKLAAKAATAEFERWQPLLAPHSCGLLHGRLSAEEKEATMTAFRSGQLQALISTTVIEVGVDVPNANVMLIENAERFGLAQLHQLRGRIGRGAHTSYCILIPGKNNEAAREKLGILEETTDGFRVAESDLAQRGPGDIVGTAQTGLPPLRLGDLLRDHQQMLDARTTAQAIFEKDPDLQLREHARLKHWLATRPTTALAG
ncbi:MAG: ATP-dependent DNA helicase RecG [Chthoniobacterales bacterium]